MKQSDILKFLAKNLKLKTADLESVNKALKAKEKAKDKAKEQTTTAPDTKYRLAGKKLGHYGFTGQIKALTSEGVKVFETKKVALIPYDSIETFDVAKPREKRLVNAAPKAAAKPGAPIPAQAKLKSKAKQIEDSDDFDDDDDDEYDDDDMEPIKRRKISRSGGGQNGSKYIPKKN